MKASVSVIVPCYRCASTIDRAVQSIIEQTVNPLEVILIDDASGDGTFEALTRIQNQHERSWIKVLSLSQNSGPAVARNLGWDIASSDYIAFLDADDAWQSKKIEIQYGWMQKHPDAVMTGHACKIKKDKLDMPRLPRKWTARRINRCRILLSNPFATPSVMLRREIPFRFSAAKRSSEDFLLWLEIVLKGHASYLLDVPLAFLFKQRYGVGGLSADMASMEKGELSNYRRLYEDGLISIGQYYCLAIYSRAKYLMRFGITQFRASRLFFLA